VNSGCNAFDDRTVGWENGTYCEKEVTMRLFGQSVLLLSASSGAWAQALSPAAVPALEDAALAGLIVLIGVVGGVLARRRKL
jgi:hypothetical protein